MTDERLDRMLGSLLRTGVLVASAVVAAGGIWYLAAHASDAASYRPFHPPSAGLRALATLRGPQTLILIGLLILIATPVARVVFSLAAFALERDRTYVAVTLIVLAVLLYSIAAAWM